MSADFPIYLLHRAGTVPTQAATDRSVAILKQRVEQMGSKSKFWFCGPDSPHWLLAKHSRPDTGEHWSEKLASELAELLGVPHARVELATHEGTPCVLVADVRPNENASLLHGNELMLELDPTYPSQRNYRLSEHTVYRIERSFEQHKVTIADSEVGLLPSGVDDAFGLFVGYLLLDALIGNTDRHHENWGVIAARAENAERRLDLAPSYDHASSLGRELSDSRRLTLLRSSGNHGLDAYARRTRSAIYAAGSPQPLSPLAAFERAGEMRRSARAGWLRRLTQVDVEALEGIADRLPPESASGGAVAFAKAFLRYNYRALVALFREDTR